MKMEQHTTTTARSRPQATPRARPLGGRKFTDRHATADWCARRFKPKPDFDRFEAVQILEEIGTHLPQDRRMTPQLIAHLRLLVRMTRPRDWHDGMPVVWMSVKKTAELLGITPAQVNRNENRLMAMRLITFRDSANHKRFGTRCPESERITGANGIDLSPLGTQLTYLRGMREAILETRHRKAEYRQLITRLRRRIRGIFAGMSDGSWTGPEGAPGAIDALAGEFEALLAGLRTGRAVPVEELEGYVGALQGFCARLEAGDSEALDPAEIHENDRNMRPRHHEDATPGPHRCDAHTVQRLSMNQDTGSPAVAARAADGDPCGDLYGHEGGGSGRGGSASSPPEMPPLVEDITARLRLSRLMPRLPRDLQQRLPADPDWGDIVRLGERLAEEMRIHPDLYHRIRVRIGAEAAALSMIVVAVKHGRGTVYNPGGYLRGILDKISSGTYQLLPSIYGVTAEEG